MKTVEKKPTKVELNKDQLGAIKSAIATFGEGYNGVNDANKANFEPILALIKPKKTREANIKALKDGAKSLELEEAQKALRNTIDTAVTFLDVEGNINKQKITWENIKLVSKMVKFANNEKIDKLAELKKALKIKAAGTSAHHYNNQIVTAMNKFKDTWTPETTNDDLVNKAVKIFADMTLAEFEEAIIKMKAKFEEDLEANQNKKAEANQKDLEALAKIQARIDKREGKVNTEDAPTEEKQVA